MPTDSTFLSKPVMRGSSETRPGSKSSLPKISPWLLGWFEHYAKRYLRRHFHAVRISRQDQPGRSIQGPIVVYLNHPSWWDPMICLMLRKHFFPERTAYGPIDADQLERYKFFSRLGFFGVQRGAPGTGWRFLRAAREILARPQAMIWLTPQGTFCDIRQRSLPFEEGIAWLARQERPVTFLPLALEYTFWNDRLPEALARFGPSFTQADLPPPEAGPESIARALSGRLETVQNALASEAMRRDPRSFDVLVQGTSGINLVYDGWRWLKARLCGKSFQREHQP